MRVLNAYAGIGGNRHLWPNHWHITAVEADPRIAAEYQRRYPNDTVLVTDAHQHLMEHADEYDAVWSSPPCQSHSRLAKVNAARYGHELKPDPRLMAEVKHLRAIGVPHVVENVHTYYRPEVPPDLVTHRHYYWVSELPDLVAPVEQVAIGTWEGGSASHEELAARYGLEPLAAGSVPDRTQAMRNAVVPAEGLEIALLAFGKET